MLQKLKAAGIIFLGLALFAALGACSAGAAANLTPAAAASDPQASAQPQTEADPAAATVKINLNTAGADEFLTVPGMGSRMVREFQEYRPYPSILQFRREIGKYVDGPQAAEYEKYVYMPVSANTADAATLQQIPGLDESDAQALIASLPFASNEAFLTALGEYVSETELEAAGPLLQEAE